MKNEYVRKAVGRIVKDLKIKELIPLKILFFMQATTIVVLYPYLTVHMRVLGLSVEETAVTSAVVPVLAIIMPPIVGMAADRIGNFKMVLSGFSLVGGLVALLLLLVPQARMKDTYPETAILTFGCNRESGHPQLMFAESIPCQGFTNKSSSNFRMVTDGCGFTCRVTRHPLGTLPDFSHRNETSDPILKGLSYLVEVEAHNGTSWSMYNLTTNKMSNDEEKDWKPVNSHVHYHRWIRRVSMDQYFFPSELVPGFQCEGNSNNTDSSSLAHRSSQKGFRCAVGVGDGSLVMTESSTVDWFNRTPIARSPYGGAGSTAANLGDWTCLDLVEQEEESVAVRVFLPDGEKEPVKLSHCEAACLLRVERKEMCSNLYEEIIYDPSLTFWTYLVVRVIVGIVGSTSYALFEVAAISVLREYKADYGLQRLYGSIGNMVASPLSGFLIDYASEGRAVPDFKPAFYLYAGLKVICSLLMLLINLEFKQPAKTVVSDFLLVIKNFEVIFLLVSCFALGAAWGYIESFLFWFLEDLGGNRSLMGITVTVGGFAGIPLLILSGPIIKRIGHANVLFIGFLFYAIRLLGYSLIHNPYHCLFFEAMESITTSLAFTAAITYGAKLSSTSTDGSIQGLVGGLHYGVGKGAGTLVGGYLMDAYGPRATFRIFSAGSLTVGLIYFLINRFFINKLENRADNDICKKEIKEKPQADLAVKSLPEMQEKESGKKEKEPVNGMEEHDNRGYIASDNSEEERDSPDAKKE